MTAARRIIPDARAEGILPETETCAGCKMPAIEDLWHKPPEEWEKYGHQVNQLPEERSINIGTAQHWITRNYHYPLAVASLHDTAQA